MSIRYRLYEFDQNWIATPESTKAFLDKLGGYESSPLADLSTAQWLSTLKHALVAGAKAVLLQESVRDPDFLEEYEAFYCKQQKNVSKLCRRLHFFSLGVNSNDHPNEVNELLNYIDRAATTESCYVGFVTLRPLRHAPIGATILRALPTAPVTCSDEFPVHIAGRDFVVSGTPYLQQDNAVGACAQASIWVALRTLRKRVGNSAYSPAELTVAATKHVTLNRVFPGRHGLTTHQMLEAIRSAGHDPLIIEPAGDTAEKRAVQAIQFATPYLESGLPVIIGLNDEITGGHAVVAIGYTHPELGKSHPDLLTIHNDNTGCYINLPQSLNDASNYALDQSIALITPLPDGICMTAAEAETLASSAISFGAPFLRIIPPIADSMAGGFGSQVQLVLRVFLSTRHSFRHWATNATDIDTPTKQTYRTAEIPRFIWVAEIHDCASFERGGFKNQSRLGEVVLDASADAMHGDALLFLRLSGKLIGTTAPDDGILMIERQAENRELIAIKAPASFGQSEPWK